MFKCRSCEGRHSTLLHVNTKDTVSNYSATTNLNEKTNTPMSTMNENGFSSPSFSGTAQSDMRVVLATALVRIKDQTGNYVPIRILLDSGSQVSAMTMECTIRLGLPRSKKRTDIVGLSQQPVTTVKGVTRCVFVPSTADSPQFQAENVVVLPKITTLMPNEKLPDSVRGQYGHLSLADPGFNVPGPIKMLIGSDLYPFILNARSEIIHNPGLPSALSTQLGWVVVGTVNNSTSAPTVSLAISAKPVIDELMYQFWTVEEPEDPVSPCSDANICENWFTKTVIRDKSGRFHVALPFQDVVQSVAKGTPEQEKKSCNMQTFGLGATRSLALNRLYNLERRP